MGYIDKEKFKEKLINKQIMTGFYNSMLSIVFDTLDKEEEIDIVHCKDCDYYEKDKNYPPYCFNMKNLFKEMKPDDYCSYGVRIKENNEVQK